MFIRALYQAAMAFSLVVLAIHAAFPKIGGRRVPVTSIVLFGIGIPLAGWFFSNFTQGSFFIIPGCMAFMFVHESRDSDAARIARRTAEDEQLQHCENMIFEDPDNGAAVEMKAAILARRAEAERPRKRSELREFFDGLLLLTALAVMYHRWDWGLNLLSLTLFNFWYRSGGGH